MKTAVVLMLSMAAISCAQDRKPENKPGNQADRQITQNPGDKNPGDRKRLESVTWDLKSHTLVWVIQTGEEKNGQFVANRSDRYEIKPDKATMSFANEMRGFTQEEAASLHKLLDTLSLYCAESVVWWDQGEGQPLDGNGTPTERRTTPERRDRTPEPRKHRVEGDPAAPADTRHVLVAKSR